MDIISYSLSKKIAASAVSGVQSMSVSGQTLTINTKDSGVLTMTFPKPRDGVSITDIDVNANNQIVFTMSDGTEFISGKIPTVKGDAGVSPTITENADNTDKIYKLDVTTADGTFTTPNLKGADGQGGSGGSGEENKIDSISVNGVNVPADENKNVDITVPDAYDDTALSNRVKTIEDDYAKSSDIPSLSGYVTETELEAKGYLTSHQDISGKVDKVDGKSLIADTEIERLASVDNYDDTQVKTQIQAVANGLMDSVGYSADYKTIDIIAKNGVKKSVNVAPIISHASITELSDVDTTNKATGKALVYNATTSKHEYADVSGTDEKVKMDASTDAKYLGELLDNITIVNENGELKVKKLDGQEVTITEINYLKGLTMNVMDLVNMFSNGGVKIINTPVATYAELLTLDKSSFIEGISYLVYVLADENHDNAKTTYLVDKDSETPTYFGFADSQRDFTTNPIDLATEITGKLGIANMDSDAIKALFTVDDTYKTETATNNAFGTHGAKALYDELLLAIGNKANNSDLTAHKDDADIHVSTTEKDNWNGKADASDLTAHTDDADIHVTAENKATWNTVSDKVDKETGKSLLADTDKTNYDDAVTKAHTHENKEVLDGITSDKVTAWDNKSEFSGSYNDLNDKPTIDVELSNTSENAIQNKVVTKEINKLYSDISFNDHDTATSGTSFTDAEDGNMLVTDWTKNLLNPTLETCEHDGITCTNNGDGTYTLNGTATTDFLEHSDKLPIPTEAKNKTLIFYDGLPDALRGYACVRFFDAKGECIGELNKTVHKMEISEATHYDFVIFSMTGAVNDNLLLKPILTTDLNATYDDFVPYDGYEIKSCGKNLLDPNDYIDGRNIKNDFDTLYSVNTNTDGRPWIYGNSNYYFKAKTQNMTLIIDVVESCNLGGFGVYSEDGIVIYDRYGEEFSNTGIHKYVLNVEPEKMYGIMLKLYSGKVKISLYNSDETEYEPYTGETITVTNDTESPAFGLKSHKGLTHIISPANVKVTYPTNESGKGVLDSLYNKDKILTEQNESLSVIGKCKNLFNPILPTTTINGVTCTNNGNGTYTLNGTATANAYFGLEIFSKFEDNIYKIVGFKNPTINIYLYMNAQTLDGETDYSILMESIKPTGYISKNKYKTIDIGIAITSGTTLTNEIVKPMLTTDLNATYDDFVPYTGDGKTLTHDVAEINSNLVEQKMLGWSVLSECPIQNKVSGNTFTQRVGRADLGSLTWNYILNGQFFYADLQGGEIGNNNAYCSRYNLSNSSSYAEMANGEFRVSVSSETVSRVYVKDTSYTDGTAFKNAMQGVYIYYELETPITKTIDGNEAVADLKNDLGGLTFSASGTTLTITDGTNTWTLAANS